jgi:hypothetical protein
VAEKKFGLKRSIAAIQRMLGMRDEILSLRSSEMIKKKKFLQSWSRVSKAR